jgi:TPP-dependent trihydroxycyclohexane-1,2-dione (THcHDO) dehydratase
MTESIRVTVGEALVRFLIAPSTTVNDALKPVTRYWDRIASPTQILSALPNAVVVCLVRLLGSPNPETSGRAG